MLVEPRWLSEQLRDRADVRVVDVRWYLGGRSGREEWAKGHIPTAVFADLDSELSRPGGAPGPGGRHPLPEVGSFASLLSRLGVSRATVVVGYDDAGGTVAARLWWLLRHHGLSTGRVLDGGLQGWLSEGFPLEVEAQHQPPAPAPLLELDTRTDDTIDANDLAVARMDPSFVLLDARARPRFEGRVEPVDPRPGHIPGAKCAPTSQNLEGHRFAELAVLRARYAALGALELDRRVACYCGSGVTACHDLLALALLGRSDVLLYPGSFSEWSADSARSVSRFVDS